MAITSALLGMAALSLALAGAVIASSGFGRTLPRGSVGAFLGVFLFLFQTILSSSNVLFRWATRRPLAPNAPRFVIRQAALNLLAYVVIGIGIVFLASTLGEEFQIWVGVPLAVAAFPLYQHLIKPRLLFSRSVGFGRYQDQIAETATWLKETAPRHGIGQLHLALIPGDLINAFATGTTLTGQWILLGEGLVKHMSALEIRAVVAHELAHLIRHDVPRIIAIAVVFGVMQTFVLINAIFPLYDAGRFVAGSVVGGLSGGALLGILPGLIVQRIELATDRLGAKLSGDAESACSALIRLAQLSHRSIDRGSLTHPPTSKRLEAIRATAK